ncbi:cobalamin B12-binding domain-containing protein [Ectothiorhodospira lacustris]|uniref:cobalamin B12-binding domain-containing protein n=1 Tax=Ectothiorhodospira lacustris TaxID=2899127 RepID=UPI001EE7B8D7|nr:cobalamin-dependent protein [Ectothiorhodospira lacustris]MCG5501269.1 cobalamin-dependent protein [Ectothiorhodospira lacustris]
MLDGHGPDVDGRSPRNGETADSLPDQDTVRLRTELSRVIEGEIIPRLMLAHRTRANGDGRRADASRGRGSVTLGPDAAPINVQSVEEFARLVMEHDTAAASSYVDMLRARGASLEMIFMQLLAPTAKRLGRLWEIDQADFTEVTVGLCRLQHVLRELGGIFEGELGRDSPSQKRVLMTPVPGEYHTFGLLMVSEFFRRAGWEVTCDPAIGAAELNHLVHQEWFDVVALSVSCGPLLERVSGTIKGIRRASRNPSVGILMGGRLFAENPQLVSVVGADMTAADGNEAVRRAEEMLVRRVGRVSQQVY